MSLDAPSAAPPSTSGVAARVTRQIVELLNQGVRPWTPPWFGGDALALPLRANGQAYRGVNVLILWAAAQTHGFSSRRWFSFRQAKALGGAVRRGARATHVIFYSPAEARDDAPNSAATKEATTSPERRAILRSFAVFNGDQIDNLPETMIGPLQICASSEADIALTARLEPLFARVPATVRHGGARACYAPDADVILMPPRTAFSSAAAYFATLAHELAHWTGHATRLDRDLQTRRTPLAYAREELVAELAAAFLGAELHLPPDHIEDHAAYIDSYLKILDREPGALLAAAGKAQAAVDVLRSWMRPPAEDIAQAAT